MMLKVITIIVPQRGGLWVINQKLMWLPINFFYFRCAYFQVYIVLIPVYALRLVLSQILQEQDLKLQFICEWFSEEWSQGKTERREKWDSHEEKPDKHVGLLLKCSFSLKPQGEVEHEWHCRVLPLCDNRCFCPLFFKTISLTCWLWDALEIYTPRHLQSVTFLLSKSNSWKNILAAGSQVDEMFTGLIRETLRKDTNYLPRNPTYFLYNYLNWYTISASLEVLCP